MYYLFYIFLIEEIIFCYFSGKVNEYEIFLVQFYEVFVYI